MSDTEDKKTRSSSRGSSAHSDVNNGGTKTPVRNDDVELAASKSLDPSPGSSGRSSRASLSGKRSGSAHSDLLLTKPLPPINPNTADTEDTTQEAAHADSAVFNKSMAASLPSSPASSGKRTRLGSSKKEFNEDAVSVKSADSRRAVSFCDGNKEESPAEREVTKRIGYDGVEYIMVSMDTQTEWSWLTDMKHRSSDSRESFANLSSNKPRSGDEDEELDSENDHVDAKKPKKKDARESKKSQSSSTAAAAKPEEPPIGYPEQQFDDQYGIPMLDIDTDSEFSEDDDDASPPPVVQDSSLLPSIGPPQILQYNRESQQQEFMIAEEDEADGDEEPMVPLPGAKCEFCGKTVKPYPSMDDQQDKNIEDLYCCDEYREIVHYALTHPLNQEYFRDKDIDIKPHAPYGSKQARKAAKERAALRARERETQRQQAAAATASSAMAASNFFSIARQMKTINYQLSSMRCLEEGWTVRAPTPLKDTAEEPLMFEPEPLSEYGDDDDAELLSWKQPSKGRRRRLIQKFYEDGRKFLTMFPDGSGHILYPSGCPAVVICRVGRGKLTYLLYDDALEKNYPQHLLGGFEPTGYGYCYYTAGNLRLFLDQLGGVEHDTNGGRKRRWAWKDHTQHVHAPPFQPICFAISPSLSLRVMSQDNIAVTFRNKNRSCRINVGVRLKLVDPSFIPPREIDDDALYIRDTKAKVETILNKVSNLLKFPKSPKLESIKPPTHLTSMIEKTERLRTEAVAVRRSREKKPGPAQGSLPVVTVN